LANGEKFPVRVYGCAQMTKCRIIAAVPSDLNAFLLQLRISVLVTASFHPGTFLSPDSAIGFGPFHFLELGAAAILMLLVPMRTSVQAKFRELADRTGWSMLLLAALSIGLRLALLPHCPIPVPSGSDDFAYLLLADTLRHFRLANAPHALPQFFEQIFVLQRPTYSSIYPLGQGLVLALGWMVSGLPWAGVLVASGLLSALCYWTLRGWTTPAWALVGGLLATFEFGPLCYWTNCYWGGAVSAIAGCLVFGALPRLRQNVGGAKRYRHAALLGVGLALQLLTRPYEFLLVAISLGLFFAPMLFGSIEWFQVAKVLGVTALPLFAAGALAAFQNKAVTGKWTTLPYALSRYEYGVPTTFTFKPNPVPHRQLNAEQELDYAAQSEIHGPGTDTLRRYVQRLLYRVRFYRFFFLAPLYLALLSFIVTIREFRFAWILLTFLVFALGTNFYPYFYPHYIAAITCLFVLASVLGLQGLSNFEIHGRIVGREIAGIVFLVCAAQFLFWYGLHAWSNEKALSAIGRFETWNFINYGDPEGRLLIARKLAQKPGRQLVFVRYGPQHGFHEWVHNAADVDAAQTVWAHDLGSGENETLRAYYPDRTVWLLEPDVRPPKLSPYRPKKGVFEDVP
jgi:hypothetical protein